MNDVFYVYELVDPFTNIPFYIGKGKKDRMYKHEYLVKNGLIPNNNRHLFNKIKEIHDKSGDVIYKKIMENLDENTSFLIESDQIKRIGRSDLKLGPLCNLTDGGEGTAGADHSGVKNGMFGKKHTDSSKYIISEKRRNRIWNFHHSEEHKKLLRECNPGGIKTSYPILQFDINGILIKEWPSISKASKSLFGDGKNFISSISHSTKKLISYNTFIWIKKYDKRVIVKNNKIENAELFKIRSINNKYIKKLGQLDDNKNIIKVWKSMSDACDYLCLKLPSISKVVRNGKKYKGYYWKII